MRLRSWPPLTTPIPWRLRGRQEVSSRGQPPEFVNRRPDQPENRCEDHDERHPLGVPTQRVAFPPGEGTLKHLQSPLSPALTCGYGGRFADSRGEIYKTEQTRRRILPRR